MESIQSAAYAICLTLIATGVFTMLMPSNNMEKVLKFAVSLFFLSSIVLPFLRGDFHFSLDLSQQEQTVDTQPLEAQTTQSFAKLAEHRLETEAENVLTLQGITPKKVEAAIHIGDDNCITISTLTITLHAADFLQAESVKESIAEEVGLTPEIIIEEAEI